ncbi:MAG: hypothetical protein HFE36_03715 [Clostridia bacterium]|nr:hypothetical protein [Clostridia bacterium]
MKTEKTTIKLGIIATVILSCCLALSAVAFFGGGSFNSLAANAENEKEIKISACSGVTYDGSKISFTVGFDKSVEMFDNNYNYVGVGGLDEYDNPAMCWADDWFSASCGVSLTKGGNADTVGTTQYVRRHLNDVIGKYVYINGVSVRDIMLSAVAHKGNINPKGSGLTGIGGVYTQVWQNIVDIRVNKNENNLIFYGIQTETPFISSLLGCDETTKTLKRPLTLTIREGYTAMDGTVLNKSVTKKFENGAWSDVADENAPDPTNNVTVAALSAPNYETAITNGVLYAGEGVFFNAYFGEKSWYDSQITPQFVTDRNWYWGLTAPESELNWFATSWNTNTGATTPKEPAQAVMQRLNSQVRDKIVIANADGTNERTLGSIADGLSVTGSAKYEKFDVLANIQADTLIFVMNKEITQDLLGWNNGEIGKEFKIIFKQGFTAMTGKTIAEDIGFTYRLASKAFERDGIEIPPEAPEEDITTPVTVSMTNFHQSKDNRRGISIEFSENIRPREVANNADVATEEWVRNGFMLNGKTFGEIYDYAKANGHNFTVNFETRNKITFWMPEAIPESEGGLKRSGEAISEKGNIVTVLKTIELPRNAPFGYESDVSFVNSGANWTMQYTFPEITEWEAVDVLGIANPESVEGGKVRYEIQFSQNVADKPYHHVNAGVDWIRAGNPNKLTEEEIEKLNHYGVFDSILDKIQITVNGVTKTVRGWQNTDENPSNFTQGVLQIHYFQQTGLNTMQILWSAMRQSAGSTVQDQPQPLNPGVNAQISITFKAGFHTPSLQEIKEDVTFTYSGEEGATFVKEKQDIVVDTVTFQKVFYNGEKITEGGTLTLPAGVFEMKKELFTVIFAEGEIPFEVSGITDMKAGDNAVTITATAGDKTETYAFTVVCSQKTDSAAEQKEKEGCGGFASGASAFAGGVTIAMSLIAAVAVLAKRRKA